MEEKCGDKNIIYEKVYPFVDTSIQADIDYYWSDENKEVYCISKDQFKTTWYRRHLYYYSMMGLQQEPKFTLYSGGIGCGCGYEIIFDVNSHIYSLVSVDSDLNRNNVYENSNWDSVRRKVDDIFDSYLILGDK